MRAEREVEREVVCGRQSVFRLREGEREAVRGCVGERVRLLIVVIRDRTRDSRCVVSWSGVCVVGVIDGVDVDRCDWGIVDEDGCGGDGRGEDG